MLKLLIFWCTRRSETGAHSDQFLLHINSRRGIVPVPLPRRRAGPGRGRGAARAAAGGSGKFPRKPLDGRDAAV